jgi:hypothetical protein
VVDSIWSFHKKLNTSSIPFTCFGPKNPQVLIVIIVFFNNDNGSYYSQNSLSILSVEEI